MYLVCFGTRPEYIKLKSIIDNVPKYKVNIKTCFTGQHRHLLDGINVDYALTFENNHSENRLNDIVINILKNTYIFENIDNVIVQGDTTTAMAMALSAFQSKIRVIHIEAGLRTFNSMDPFPEEMNRQLISKLASIHFCPTETNAQNLLKESIPEKNIHVVGNTGLDNINRNDCRYDDIVLVTMHRRNNLDIMDEWFTEIEKVAKLYPHIKFILPIHPNPKVQKHRHLLKTVNVVEPMDHDEIIEVMKKCKFIISDSGGIQEEASFLNKRIIICRETTERQEVLNTHGVLCKNPANLEKFVNYMNDNYISAEDCPFGDGFAYKKILKTINNN